MKNQKRLRITLSMVELKALQHIAEESKAGTFLNNSMKLKSICDAISSITGKSLNDLTSKKFVAFARLAWHMVLEKDIKIVNRLAQLDFESEDFKKLFEKYQTVKFAAG